MSYQQPLELHGSEGMLWMDDAWTPGSPDIEFRGNERPSQGKVVFSASANGHSEQLGHLCDCILKNTDPRFTIDEAVRNHVVMDALLEAAKSGRSVTPEMPQA